MGGADGKRVTAYLLWYHGDAITALKQLVDSCPDAGDHTAGGMTHAMLADMVKDRLGLLDVTKAKPAHLPSIYPELMEFAEDATGRGGGERRGAREWFRAPGLSG